MQADPFVQAPDNSQNLNRYSYVLNNPLSYTDPSGFFFKAIGNFIGKFWRPILAVGITVVSAGVATGALFATLEIAGTSAAWGVAIGGGALAGLVNSGNLRGALYGAFSAAAFHGVGTYFRNVAGSVAKDLGRVGRFVKNNLRLTKTIAHGLTGGIMNELQGGKFGNGFLSAGATQALAPSISEIGTGDGALSFGDQALRVASAAALGGAVSEVTGGKFANGAVTGAMSYAFGELGSRLGSNARVTGGIPNEIPAEEARLLFDEVIEALDAIGRDTSGFVFDERYGVRVQGELIPTDDYDKFLRLATGTDAVPVAGNHEGGRITIFRNAFSTKIHSFPIRGGDPLRAGPFAAGFQSGLFIAGHELSHFYGQTNERAADRQGWRLYQRVCSEHPKC